MEAMRPGVPWIDMHALTYKVMAKHLLSIGICRAEYDVETLVAAGLPNFFMPHGLGHYMGLDTHDVGRFHMGCPARTSCACADNSFSGKEAQQRPNASSTRFSQVEKGSSKFSVMQVRTGPANYPQHHKKVTLRKGSVQVHVFGLPKSTMSNSIMPGSLGS